MNARFWVYTAHSLAKLTLRPGQLLRYVEGGYTDEGYSWTETTWLHEHDRVLRRKVTEARDCDGRMDYFSEHELTNLRPEEEDCPNWHRLHISQRDYSAEAAGY